MHVLAAGELPASKNKQLGVRCESARSAKKVWPEVALPRPAEGWPRTSLALASQQKELACSSCSSSAAIG